MKYTILYLNSENDTVCSQYMITSVTEEAALLMFRREFSNKIFLALYSERACEFKLMFGKIENEPPMLTKR